ncbi:MAG: SDR family oxidoreductase [Gammaproteobacteria bacterium]|nr:SDR family oxidoreductase [Gammaproteobacteria bacterium]
MGFVGGARSAAYCASKGGVRLLTKAAAVELAPKRIRAGIRQRGVCNRHGTGGRRRLPRAVLRIAFPLENGST